MTDLLPGDVTAVATARAGAVVEFGVPIPMRDGTVLRADVIRPATDRPVPVILMRNPYGPVVPRANLDQLRAVAEGFAVVVQSVRGTGPSDGAFMPWEHEEADGYDSISWCASQPWSSGRVATYGPSYLGHVQLYAAAARHPAHAAMVPYVVPSHPYKLTYEDGALLLGSTFGWAFARTGDTIARARALGPTPDDDADWLAWVDMGGDIDGIMGTVPLRDIPIVGRRFPSWNDWLDHPAHDAWWRRLDLGDRPAMPGFWVTGWWDLFLRGTLTEWGRQPQHPASHLVIGPWSHLLDGEAHGDINYGPAASAAAQDVTGAALGFLRRVVDGDLAKDGPRVRYFVMGANEWHTAESWPPEGTVTRPWYLQPDRSLGHEVPAADAPALGYTHDPLDPVPTLGGRNLFQGTPGAYMAGPVEQSRIDDRRDLLRFTTPVLDRSLTIAGDLRVSLVATTTAADTDWTAKLVDVFPDGRAYNVADGIVRARFRDGADRPRLLAPGEPNRFEIELGPSAYSFLPGHCIRLEIASSNFPRFDRNPGTGGTSADTPAAEYVVGRQTVFVDPGHPSWLELPVATP